MRYPLLDRKNRGREHETPPLFRGTTANAGDVRVARREEGAA